MIWVLAGTGDSFALIDHLKKRGKKIIASVVTEYGEKKLENKNIKVIKKRLNSLDMQELIKEYNIDLVVDATHPFAENVSKNSMAASRLTGIEYLRYERKGVDLAQYPAQYILTVQGYQEAAQKAADYEKILLTIGSNNLNYFIDRISNWQKRLVARILPDGEFIKKAEKMGFTPGNLIGMQGPFSRELNRILFSEYGIDLVVSKASGNIGGLDTKIRAAVDLKLPIIIIKRPDIDYPLVFHDFKNLLEYCFSGDE